MLKHTQTVMLSQLVGEEYFSGKNTQIQTVTDDTRTIKSGQKTLFAFDGRNNPTHAEAFCTQALEAGAIVVSNVKQKGVLYHPFPGEVLTAWAKHQHPNQPPHVVAVTGTNGKTSTAWFYMQLMQAAGFKAACISTVGVFINGKKHSYTGYTTPTALVLHEILAELAAEGVTHVAMEASSHALELRRLDGVQFTAAAFTNLTQDHLDFHGTMDSYHAAKARLFSEIVPKNGTAVLPIQKPESWPLASICKQRGLAQIPYGSAQAKLCLEVQKSSVDGLDLILKYNDLSQSLQVPLVGDFQAENVAAAVGLALASGAKIEHLVQDIPALKSVPGRMEFIEKVPNKPTVLVDYSHTSDSLEHALKALRPLVPHSGRLICVFGAGGDRDVGKRPKMGKISADLADVSIVTDDNPRTEDAAKIRQQILQGAPHEHDIGGREKAIKFAIEMGNEKDVVLLAGKGHETGQIIGTTEIPHDDKQVALNILKGK